MSHYLKLRGGWTLTREQQAVLRLLVAWRERECQKVDRPRNRVLNDGLLIAIAERLPGSLRTLNDIQGVPGGIVKRYGEHLLELVREGREADNAKLEPIPRPLSRDQQAVYKKVKRCFNKVVEDLDIPSLAIFIPYFVAFDGEISDFSIISILFFSMEAFSLYIFFLSSKISPI